MQGLDRLLGKRMKVVTNATATGAVALDVTAGNIFVLTLTGNISALTLANGPSYPKRITVHFVQDATGSRTVTLGASVKTTAGTYVPTTTATKRSTLVLDVIDGVGYEVARALNI